MRPARPTSPSGAGEPKNGALFHAKAIIVYFTGGGEVKSLFPERREKTAKSGRRARFRALPPGFFQNLRQKMRITLTSISKKEYNTAK